MISTEEFAKCNAELKNSGKPAEKKRRTTDTQAVIHLVKSSLGTGILAMPFAFSTAGLLGGLMGTAFVGFVYTYCVHMIVQSAQDLCRRHEIQSMHVTALVETAFQRGPLRVRFMAVPVTWTVQLFLTGMTMCGCSVYTVFIASTLTEVANEWLHASVDLRLGVAAVTPILLALCMVRSLRHIAPFSLVSNLLILAAVAIILSFIFTQPLPSVHDRPFFAPVSSIPIFLSTATFAIDGVQVVMPLENSMKNPENFLGFGNVLPTVMILITVSYSVLGFFAYLKYGDYIEASVSLNLPSDSLLAQSVNLMLGLAIILTYPLALQCCVEFTWPSLTKKFNRFIQNSPILFERLYRAFLILLLSLVAALVPNLGALISLSGALFTSSIVFLLPPVLDSVVNWSSYSRTGKVLHSVKNVFIAIFGLLIAVTGTVTSVWDIIQAFSN